ncbi:hypothetical protein FEK48_20855 [Escherichia sp. E2593]|nr:hypothetical protein D9738_20975 [Escherichia sp. E10V5]TLI77933.1 hypothetical protein FEK48_20855 [Escherichia sp. E2593]
MRTCKKHPFTTATVYYGYAQHHAPRLISRREHSPTNFLRFSLVVMPVKVVRRFHHQRRVRLTTSGGTFS